MKVIAVTRGRGLVSAGAIVLVVSTLLQWWQVGGGAGELPLRSDVGISDGRVFLMFLAAIGSLLVVTLPIAARKPVAVDHPATYFGLLMVAVLGYAIRVADLAGQHLLPWPPERGVGVWVAALGLAVVATGVVGVWMGYRRLEHGQVTTVTTDAPDALADAEPAAAEPAAAEPDWAAGDRDYLEDPSMTPLYVPVWVMRAWRWLCRPSSRPDRSASLDSEPRGRLDRLDIWVVVALVLVILSMRVFNLGQPTAMYFDEVYHARSATEFLQDWRYQIPHDIYEYTHPMMAKYVIAGGIAVFADDKAGPLTTLSVPAVKDVSIQERTATSPGSLVQPFGDTEIDYATDYGDRVFVATGAEVRAYDLQTRAMAHTYSIPGASALSHPTAAGIVYVGTADGKIYSIDTNSLDDVRAGRSATVKAAVELGVDTGIQATHIYAGTPPYVLVSDGSGNVVSVDVTKSAGEIVGRGVVPGAADYADFGAGPAAAIADPQQVTGASDSHPEALVACAAGVVVLDVRNVVIDSTVGTDAPATSIALNPDLMGPAEAQFYRFYVTAGKSLVLLKMPAGASPPTLEVETDVEQLGTMPGVVTQVVFDEATKLAQVLGKTSDGKGWTVYAIESNGNAVFSDARLPFEPVAVGLDNAVDVRGLSQVGQMPDVDREALLAFGADGSMASVDVGQFAFSWRIFGVLFGALTAVCLYLFARILFRRRSVGLLVAFFSVVDGMLFAQSRIAMNDTYVGGFLLLAYLMFAVLWLRVWKARYVFWLGMPLLGVVLGLALASKWVALYAIASIGVLILIRSALGRLLTVVGLAAGTGLLGWMAVAGMRYQPGTGDGRLCVLLIVGAVAMVAAGTTWAIHTRLVPDKVFVALATALIAGLMLAGALLASPGSLDNGAPNYTFFVIMLAVTALAAAANADRPVAWTREELYFAIGAPPAVGLIGPIALALLLVPLGFPPNPASLLRVALECGLAGLGIGVAAGGVFWAAGRVGFGPLAASPCAGSLAELAGPPSPAPDGWLRFGSGFGAPAAWTMLCVAVLPFVVYLVMYVPWTMPWQPQTAATGPLPALACWHVDISSGLCDDAWPVGHTGQTLWDLTNQMYVYHDTLRASHPASSPWWAWPMDLKPVWFASGGDVPGMFSWIHDGGNPVLWWMAIVGMGFVSWQAFRRRNLGLGLIAMAFFWQWLSWSRIDRATFQYHFYTALPFFLMALAYFLAEMWHGPSRRTWLLARASGAVAALMPAALWLLKPELCGLARVNPAETFGSTVCGSATGDVVITTRVFLIVAVLVCSLLALGAVLWRLERRHAAGLEDRGWIVQLLAPVGISFALISWLGVSGPAGVLVRTALPSDSLTAVPVVCGVLLAYLAVSARNPRRFVLGVCVAAAILFAFFYPDLAALWMPNTIQGVYSVLSPTWMYGFYFSTNLQVSSPVKVLSSESLGAVMAALLVAGAAAWAARERRVVVGWRRAGPVSSARDIDETEEADVADDSDRDEP
jgi:predicted membrane-bound dolichyl-phosphate-mannose-protein mannosyltransferase